MIVVVSDVLGQYVLKMSSSEDQESIGAFSADGADESLGERVSSRCSNGRLNDPDPLGAEHLVETRRELGVPIPDEELGWARSARKVETQIARLLDNPLPHWVGGDPAEIDPPGVDLDEEQHVQTAKQHRIDGEEVAGQHGMRLRSQELCPGWACSARSGLDAMPPEDCPHARRG